MLLVLMTVVGRTQTQRTCRRKYIHLNTKCSVVRKISYKSFGSFIFRSDCLSGVGMQPKNRKSGAGGLFVCAWVCEDSFPNKFFFYVVNFVCCCFFRVSISVSNEMRILCMFVRSMKSTMKMKMHEIAWFVVYGYESRNCDQKALNKKEKTTPKCKRENGNCRNDDNARATTCRLFELECCLTHLTFDEIIYDVSPRRRYRCNAPNDTTH